MRTQVAIIGAGPAGLLLAHLLQGAGVDAWSSSGATALCRGRVRAGVLEQITVDLMERAGRGRAHARARACRTTAPTVLRRPLLPHRPRGLTGGKTVIVYGQTEVMKDLFDAAVARGLQDRVRRRGRGAARPRRRQPFVTYRKDGAEQRLDCDFVAGCDGFHGVSRATIPAALLQTFEKVYPFGWLGILADVPPANHELIYANHERGFALASMRSPTRSRYYIQCALDETSRTGPTTGSGTSCASAWGRGGGT